MRRDVYTQTVNAQAMKFLSQQTADVADAVYPELQKYRNGARTVVVS